MALVGCGAEPDSVGVQEANTHLADFDRHLVLPDESLEDSQALTLAQVQAFLENTPHGNRSVLADHVAHGRTAAQAIVDASTEYGISPLILLARLQLEQSLIGKESAGSNRLNWAMGCGCPDGGGCMSGYKGFDRQVECAAERFSTYLHQLETDGATVAGWAVGKPNSSLEGKQIRPRNFHTAALYTYTPWVSSAKQFLGLYRKYAEFLGYAAPAPGGCPTATFPSGVDVQLRPDEGLADHVEQDDPCFVDTNVLIDHQEFVSHNPSTKVSDHFAFYEFAEAASSHQLRLAPELVTQLEATRQALGSSITIEVGWRTPDEATSLCWGASDPICERGELTDGTAVIVSSNAGHAALVEAAASVGVPSCITQDAGVYLGVGEPALGCPSL
jgi:hypothetical protein